MLLDTASFVLEASPDYPYHITSKRYTNPNLNNVDDTAITLVLTHATGMHKECWDLVMQHLFELCSTPGSMVKIRDAWTIDCINHGEAAVMNEDILLTHFNEQFGWDNYGRAVGRFLTAGEERGARIDFSKRNLHALGHSMGAVSLVWLQRELSIFKSLTLIEPMISPPGFDLRGGAASSWIKASYQRRDVWPSKSAASKDLLSNKGYKSWDPAMIELFVQYALRPHPASNFALQPYKGVVLSCTRFQEAACYRTDSGFAEAMAGALVPISREVPVHLIWGEIKDAISQPIQEALGDESQSNIRAASSRSIPGVGHLAVQASPPGVAKAVLEALAVENAKGISSRL
ncbi:hypothetical protein FRB94_011655 [Tulasnella sp. JGI-2019a]|nr:hypothetical protein FRB93_001047 [Tulasnella sp. JGI-2019a]KAG9009650.1 hypothetical protein FRB94_011655 [Tulasnella sp. JGI-2019a]